MIGSSSNSPTSRNLFTVTLLPSKIGGIPILALPAHRDAEISFFTQFTQAKAHVIPSRFKDFFPSRYVTRNPSEESHSRIHIRVRRESGG
jgi:2,3-dihydroxybenzoate-AMP ligase